MSGMVPRICWLAGSMTSTLAFVLASRQLPPISACWRNRSWSFNAVIYLFLGLRVQLRHHVDCAWRDKSSRPRDTGLQAAFFIENKWPDGVESGQTRPRKSIVLATEYWRPPSAQRSVIMTDVDLSHGLNRAPDADKAGLHDKAVAGAVGLRLTPLFLN